MAGFWDHYARTNDDVRTHLIDRAWFKERIPTHDMHNDVHQMQEEQSDPQREDLYGTVITQDPNVPAGLQQSGMNPATDQNPEATRSAVEEFYGTRETPQGAEIGQENMRPEWSPHPAEIDIERHDLYGYDALDEEQDHAQNQTL